MCVAIDKEGKGLTQMGIWKDAIFGCIVGDALGVPVEFLSRAALKKDPVTDMREFGSHHQPRGTWSDDSSMILAEIKSMKDLSGIDFDDIMKNFVKWERNGKFTPFGEVFDIGITCAEAIEKYAREGDFRHCGKDDYHSNGNGSLMRIMPFCLFAVENDYRKTEAEEIISTASALTHAHKVSKDCCIIYYNLVRSIIKTHSIPDDLVKKYKGLDEASIESSGFVMDTLEASSFCLVNSSSYKECVLKAVNLGDDTDTTGCVAGGLAGLYYGFDSIPEEWVGCLQKREEISELIYEMDDAEV